VAKQAGIAEDMSQVVSGEQLDAMGKSQRAAAIKNARVFARVTPAHKNIIVKLKKSAGEVVAMTGDGVNDAPSVKSADIGIAMGISGTDVTKNVADMVIADDNFTTIVAAVREGRRIFANIKKTIQFFLSTNLGEVLSVLVAALVFFRYDFLLSTQLLWINLITDSFPVLALGTERGDFGAMSRPPERAEKSLFSKSSIFVIVLSGVYIACATVGVYAFALFNYGNKVATTMTFLTVSFLELLHAFNIRSERLSAFTKGEPVNKILLITVAAGVVINVLLAISPLSAIFGLVNLDVAQWLIVTFVSLSVIPFGEFYKFLLRRATKYKNVSKARLQNL
jgi:Ca2+-transporting ATPase